MPDGELITVERSDRGLCEFQKGSDLWPTP
jgi:hypothetical protein